MFGQSLFEQMSPEVRARMLQADKKRKEEERIKEFATAPSRGRELAPTYRDSYDAGEPTSFKEAKQAAD